MLSIPFSNQEMMRLKKRIALLVLSTLMLLTMLPATAFAGDKPVFSVSSTTDHVNIGEDILITIDSPDAKDVYGYELRLSYDPKALTFLDATASRDGFTVPPIVEDGSIIFAHTKVGRQKGENGPIRLADVRFRAIGPGDTRVQLTRVKLVDSEVVGTTVEPGAFVKISVAYPASYTDTKGHWAEGDIARATEMGWIKGLPDGRFAPDQAITRAEFVTMLSRALGLQAPAGQARLFGDHASIPEYAKPHVAQAAAAGLVKGYPDGTFRPLHTITNAELVVILMRAVGYDDRTDAGTPLPYVDADPIPKWAYPAVAAATEQGIVKGKSGNRFAPGGHATRAEAVALILRVLDQ
jgi:hypothetical protein